jgi:hypothetical protein
MRSVEAHRKIVFAAALAILVAGATAMALLDRPEKDSTPSHAGRASALAVAEHQAPNRGREIREASFSATSFVRAYLHYEGGALRSADRESLVRYSTSQFGGQLLDAPVRIPPGSQPPRQIVARIAAVQAGLFEGRPDLLVSLVVAGSSGTHLLRATVIRQDTGWVVAGVGP